ncbi:MAG: 7-carboxy-7-deazaguanine synthase [Solirubrobacterales bacterium]
MSYAVKEIFHTLQGEGAHTGRSAVFLRLAGCNLWSGREQDRADATCRFCDTDFVGGEKFTDAARLADAVLAAWPAGDLGRFVVVTGGEPSLQLDEGLIEALHGRGFEIAIETNGTRPLPVGIDWVCVSPKAGTELAVTSGHELKLVFPQPGAEPERFAALRFGHFFLQPMDGPDRVANTMAAVAYCRTHPRWRLSLQTHKLIGFP